MFTLLAQFVLGIESLIFIVLRVSKFLGEIWLYERVAAGPV